MNKQKLIIIDTTIIVQKLLSICAPYFGVGDLEEIICQSMETIMGDGFHDCPGDGLIYRMKQDGIAEWNPFPDFSRLCLNIKKDTLEYNICIRNLINAIIVFKNELTDIISSITCVDDKYNFYYNSMCRYEIVLSILPY